MNARTPGWTGPAARGLLWLGLVGLGLGLLAVAGCSGDAPEPGPAGASAPCTALIGRLPARVLGSARHELDVTGAAAWGDPSIVLRCGVPPTGPTADDCIAIDDVDWTLHESGKGYRFTTFGRTPAVEVMVPTSVDRTAATAGIIDLEPAIRPLARTADACKA